MQQNDSSHIRNTAELFINNAPTMSYRSSSAGGSMPPGYEIARAHSINLITEEFLSGFMQDGRMSVVRRFFCLFVTFDLIFVSLLWLICIMINGDNIYQAFQTQIVHYSINTSLADVVAASLCRFIILLLFYALLYINHWFIIAFSTSGSCLFLISKVFVYDWVDSKQQVFEVILVITSFVLAWGEAWFLDCRVIPQERHARRYFNALTTSERTPLVAPFLASQEQHRPPDSVANFYSPLDSAHNSDDEEEQDQEYHQMGLDCVRKVYELLESNEWKVEKVTSKGDTIHSMQREKLGRIYKLTARIKYPAKPLLDELFYKVDDIPKWNPTVLESKLIRKINSYTDITYQASVGGGGGLVKSRDFVNLRCWRLMRNGRICDNDEIEEVNASSDEENLLNRSCEGSVSTVSDGNDDSATPLPSSFGSVKNYTVDDAPPIPYITLSKSLGGRGFMTTQSNSPPLSKSPIPAPLSIDFDEPPPLENTEFHDASESLDEKPKSSVYCTGTTKDSVWITSAISVNYTAVPPTPKYTRGENIVTGFAFRDIIGKSDACIVEWVLCLDLKGYIPRYVLDTAYTTFMSDYMKHMRKYVSELRQKRKLSSRH